MEIIVHANKKKTEIVGVLNNKIVLNVKAKPLNNKANQEVIKFFRKNKEYNYENLNVKIVKGLKNKNKVLKFF